MVAEICCKPCSDARFPDALVVHLQGGCCRCAESVKSSACGSCDESGQCQECLALNQSVVVRRLTPDSLVYEYQFRSGDFASRKKPCDVEKATLELIKHQKQGQVWYSACFAIKFPADSGKRTATWYRSRVIDCCNIGLLRRHAPGRTCCWSQFIEVQTVPTPDFVPPPPEWTRGHPDDLNDADYWPSLDIPLMQDSPEVSVRYFNGELQFRIKDLGSDGYGVPWGHTRIYSNRLSNSYDFGNGTNWLIHEWPQLVRRKTDPREVRLFHPHVVEKSGSVPTGCTLVMLRGTRNTLWFDEFVDVEGKTEWRARFGAKHTLEFNQTKKCHRIITPHGHKWEFYPFSRPCYTPKSNQLPSHDHRLDGKLIRHVNPGGHAIIANYTDGKLESFERTAKGVTESFAYEYFAAGDNEGRLRFVTWMRGGKKLERTEYTYYGKQEPYGTLGDLKTAKTAFRVGNDWKHREDCVHYYRYHVQPNDTYCQGMLMFVVGPEAFHRIRKAGHGDPLTASNQIIKEFADLSVTYYGDRRVKTISLFGGGRKHFFEYQKKRAIRSTLPPGSSTPGYPGYEVWHSLTTETRPDGTKKEVASNFIGQTLRHDLVGEDGVRWVHAWEIDPFYASVNRFFTPTSVQNTRFDPQTSLPPFFPKAGLVRRFTYFLPPSREGELPEILPPPAFPFDPEFDDVVPDPLPGLGPEIPRSRLPRPLEPGIDKVRAYLGSVHEDQGYEGAQLPLKSYQYDEVNAAYGIWALRSETAHGIAVDASGNKQDGVTIFGTYFQYTATNQDQEDGLALLKERRVTLPTVNTEHFVHAEDYLPSNVQGVIHQLFDSYGNLSISVDQRNKYTVTFVNVPKGTPRREEIVYRDRKGNQQRLVFDYLADDYGRITQIVGPPHLATVDVKQPEELVRSVTWYTYKVFSGEVWTSQGYVRGQGGAGGENLTGAVFVNPVMIKKQDLAGRITDDIQAVRNLGGRPNPSETLDQRTWVRWTHQEHDNKRTSVTNRMYHLIPDQGTGVIGDNYHETTTSSDLGSRQKSVSTSSGTQYEVDFEPRGLPTLVKAGCDPSDFKVVATVAYDSGQGGGNGYLTDLKRKDGSDKAGGGKKERKTTFEYDYRGRQSRVTEADGTSVDYEYNNHTTVHKMTRSAPLRGVLAEKFHWIDVRGRVYLKQLNGFQYRNANAPLTPLQEFFLYDDSNLLVAAIPHGGTMVDEEGASFQPVNTTEYDGMGRETVQKSMIRTGGGLETYRQTETYRNDAGDVVLVTTRSRFPDSKLTTGRSVGPLGDASGNSGTGNAGLTPARVSNFGVWFDPLGRRIASAELGTANFSGFRPDQIAPDVFPTTEYKLNKRGQLAEIVDPVRNNSRFAFDHAGRCTYQANNWDARPFEQLSQLGLDPSSFTLADDATLTQFAYTSENNIARSVTQNTHTGPQTTQVSYGNNLFSPGSSPASASLPRETVDAEGRRVQITYNLLGEVESRTDSNGTVHAYEYDEAGRVVKDRIASCDSAVIDTQVMRIEYVYDEFGRLNAIHSFDSGASSGGNIVNSIVRKYGTYNELIAEAQLHSGKESGRLINDKDIFHGDASRSGELRRSGISQPGVVGYYYDYPTLTANYHRLSFIWYPGSPTRPKGRWISQIAKPRDIVLGRNSEVLEELRDEDSPVESDVEHFAAYEYFGEDEIHGVKLGGRYQFDLSSAGSAPFSSLDSLGREQRRKWTRDRLAVLEDASVARDLGGRLLARKINLAQSVGNDDIFDFDRLSRVTRQRRSKVVLPSAVTTAPKPVESTPRKYMQRWRKDQSSNWRVVLRRNFLTQPRNEFQQRQHSRTNDITRFLIKTWPSPLYDAAGQMVQLPLPGSPTTPATAKYDGWGRLTSLTDSAGNNTDFKYDGVGRRIVQKTPAGEERHFYYDQAGRVISEMVLANNKYALDREYIWDPNSSVRLACRIRQRQAGPEFLYPFHDILGNVVALADRFGLVTERYLYDPQGHVTYLDANFNEKNPQVSGYEWEYLRAGLRFDRITGFHFAGAGYYHPDLGRGLPGGQVPVLSESALNGYVQDFPFGGYRPPGIVGMLAGERTLKWINENAPWLKFTVGAVALAVTIGGIILAAPTGPAACFAALGATCGAIQGGVGAALSGGDYGDIMLSVGVGAMFGAIAPWGGIGSLIGSNVGIVGAAMARGAGQEWITLSMGWEFGGLIGGISGDIAGGAVKAAQNGIRRPLLTAFSHSGYDLLGAGAGAMIGYGVGGDLNSAYHGATIGMMVGSLTGATARGAWGVSRARGGLRGSATGEGRLGQFMRTGRIDARTEAQMDRIVRRIARRMGVGQEWEVSFEVVQPNDLSVTIASVYPNRTALEGGEIIFDKGILLSDARLQQLPLRSRIEAVLVHEVVEGENIIALRKLGVREQDVETLYTHNAAISDSPFTDMAISKGARNYLKAWRKYGPYSSGVY